MLHARNLCHEVTMLIVTVLQWSRKHCLIMRSLVNTIMQLNCTQMKHIHECEIGCTKGGGSGGWGGGGGGGGEDGVRVRTSMVPVTHVVLT